MRVLITGGAGFIGTNLIAYLLARSAYQIRILDNESLGKRAYLTEFNRIEFIHGDIRDTSVLREAMEGCEVVVHLAADTRVIDSITDPVKNFSINVVGSFEVLQQARDAGIRRIVGASTGGAILGEAEPPIHEGIAASPISPYGASKLAVEGYMSAFSGSYGLSAVSLRFSNIYGSRSYHKGSVVATFYKRLLAGRPLIVYGDGSQRRDFLYADDLVVGIEQAIRSEARGVYQLGSGRPTSVSELIDIMRSVVEPQVQVMVEYEDFRQGEIHSTWCDVSRAQRAFGFAPATPLEEGLRNTWQWFLSAFERRFS